MQKDSHISQYPDNVQRPLTSLKLESCERLPTQLKPGAPFGMNERFYYLNVN